MNQTAQFLCDEQFELALASAEKALEKNPRDARNLEYKAIALKRSGRLREALQYYDKALAIEPNDGDTWFNRAICIRAMNDREMHDEASRSYQKAVEVDPSCSDAFQNLGNVSSRIGDCAGDAAEAKSWFEQSEAAYRNALRANPGSAELHCNLADLYVKQKRMADALKELAQAEALDGAYLPLWYIRGFALMQLRRFDEALASFARVGQLDEASGWNMRARINAGLCEIELGRMDEAVERFEQAAAMDPPGFEEFVYMSRANAWYNIAFVRKMQGRMDEAGRALKRSYENDYTFQLEHWLYEPKKEITGPAAKNEEHIKG